MGVEALAQAINYTTGMKFLFVLVVLLGITFSEDAVTIDQSTLEKLADLRRKAGDEVTGETPCELCHDTAKWLENLMLNKGLESFVEKLLMAICKALKPISELAFGECEHFDKTFLSDIWELVMEQYLDPTKLCQKACSK